MACGIAVCMQRRERICASLLRAGASADEMRALIRAGWEGRRDRGAEERKALERDGLRVGGLIGIEKLREDPHLEMHARGG